MKNYRFVSSMSVLALLLAFENVGRATDTPPGVSKFQTLEQIATDSLETNIIQLKEGSFLRAGSHQFQALWTRDFCFGSRGLLRVGRADVVKSQLTLLLNHLRDSDGLAPKLFDSYPASLRYFYLIFRHYLPIQDPLHPSYDEGIRPRITADANALVLLTAIDYLNHTGDVQWWNEHSEQLVRAYRFYDRFKEDGLIRQGELADWQDTVTRPGKTLYTNMLYFAASERLAKFPEFGITQEGLQQMRREIIGNFYDPNKELYFSIVGQPYYSLDGMLLAIDLGFFAPESQEAQDLYFYLKMSPLWTRNGGMPGFSTFPDYPSSWVPTLVRMGGQVRHYHDSMYWGWLMSLSAKVAYLMKDEAEGDRILAKVQELAVRDGAIFEIYDNNPELTVFDHGPYRSEGPFTWGAGVTLDALGAMPGRP